MDDGCWVLVLRPSTALVPTKSKLLYSAVMNCGKPSLCATTGSDNSELSQQFYDGSRWFKLKLECFIALRYYLSRVDKKYLYHLHQWIIASCGLSALNQAKLQTTNYFLELIYAPLLPQRGSLVWVHTVPMHVTLP